jgi:hypothetical protein
MHFSKDAGNDAEEVQMRKWCLSSVAALGLATVLIVLATPRPAHAFIHEIIAALCRAPDGDVEPPGQSQPDSKAFVRALMATGFIQSIEETATQTIIHFDPTVPNAKFKSAGFDLPIDGAGTDGKTLVLSPLVIPDPDFAAHAHCKNF